MMGLDLENRSECSPIWVYIVICKKLQVTAGIQTEGEKINGVNY